MYNVTFQTLILLMNTIVTKAKIYKNQNVDISTWSITKLKKIPNYMHRFLKKPALAWIFLYLYNRLYISIVLPSFQIKNQAKEIPGG